ncbi:hypothetical protein [Papillibacter cinnamivorans]|uniref:Uncharacterized protein n=1 Tax=Papillibacter cinnamivorans DSM 12816 TaxID=1122930 RepID=A0A1W1YYC8_9FIRM|nr:hypothetical protein [Papillibacter cinnamivorans]SMC41133.1 hypothetical protein SAMN02745168_0776 [Papillibacter cinnamivorans DSM 12816]
MSGKKRKGGNKTQPDSYINLVTALINLVLAVILLYEKLKS